MAALAATPLLVSTPLHAQASPPQPAPSTTTPAAPPAQAPSSAEAKRTPILEQTALDLLKKMSAKLAAAKAFSVSARGLRETPSTEGQMLTSIESLQVDVKRPSFMRAELKSGNDDTLVVYDGKDLSILVRNKNVFVVTDAPKTLDELLTFAAEKHGLHIAVADFLFSDPYAVMSKGLTNAYEAPATTIDGVAVRHLLFAAPGIEWQLWLDSRTDLPRLFAVTYLDAVRTPHFLVEFKDWRLRNDVPAQAFRFAPPKQAARIEPLPAN